MRSVLALRAGLSGLCGHIVVELCDIDNLLLLDLHAMQGDSIVGQGNGTPKPVSKTTVLPIVSHDIIGRLMTSARGILTWLRCTQS